MTLYRILLRSLRRSSANATTSVAAAARTQFISVNHLQNPSFLLPHRSFAFSSAEEAAAERRRRKRRLRIEPPLGALRRDSAPRPPPSDDPRSRLPDSTSALVGPRLNLHNRVQSLIRAGDLDSAAAVARHSVFSNTRPTVFTCNAIIAAMYRAGRYNDAKALFQYFFNQSNIIPNVVSYNNLIVSHCDSGEVDEAIKVYNHILENAPFSPSYVTYRHLTKGLINSERINEAVDFLREMLNKGHGADSLVYNNLILGFLELGNLEKANELFDELKERCLVYDGTVNATFMDWFFKQGREREAMDSYKDLLDRKFRMVPATCNALLEVLLKHGRDKEALDLFDAMLDDHTPPVFQAVNSDTFNIMVNECFKLGKVSEAMDTFKKAGKSVKSKPFAMDVAGFNNMITRLCELEMMEEAEKYYTELCNKSLNPDVTTYRTMIEAYVKAEKIDGVLEKYTKMVEAGLRVIPVYANKWFNFLINKGKVLECVPILTKMGEREPRPDVMTYDIVIRALCQEGNYDASFNLLSQMVNYGVGLTSAFKEFVLEEFGKQGRRDEIDSLFSRNPTYFPNSRPRPPQVPRQAAAHQMPNHLSWQNQAMHQASQPTVMAGQGVSQIPGQPSGFAQMPGQSERYPQSAGHTTPPVMGGQGSTYNQMSGQSERYPQSAGHTTPPVMGGQGSYNQMSGQSERYPQSAGHTTPPVMGGQGSYNQMSGQSERYTQSAGHTTPPVMGGQGSAYNQMSGQTERPHWGFTPPSNVMGGQPHAFNQGSNFEQMSGQTGRPQWGQTQPSNFMGGEPRAYEQVQGHNVRPQFTEQASPPYFMEQQGGQMASGQIVGPHGAGQGSPHASTARQEAEVPQMAGRVAQFDSFGR
nr:pentatricopeptide repeat-containing protein At1g10270 isoform X2 [Ipomoea trifida]